MSEAVSNHFTFTLYTCFMLQVYKNNNKQSLTRYLYYALPNERNISISFTSNYILPIDYIILSKF